MTRAKKELGDWGERVAARYLQRKGYQILGRKARTEYGEIDLIARQGTATVFVEVKTRSNTAYGYPEAAITANKQAHLLAAAQAYLQANPSLDGDWRIDVIAILRRGNLAPEIVHFENAVG